jgi:hypothetical protein
MSEKIEVHRFTVISSVNKDTIAVATYADGARISQDLYTTTMGVEAAEKDALFKAEKFGVLTKDFERFYELIPPPQPPTPEIVPPPPPPPPTPSPEVKKKGSWYLPKSRYRKPKSTSGNEFIVKSTGEPYTGTYIETFKKKYYAGSSPEQLGEELEKVRTKGDFDLLGEAFATLSPLLLRALKGSVIRKTLTPSEIAQGEVKRYFVQDPVTEKIVEVTKPDYIELKKKLPNRKFAEVPWSIQSPAEDVKVGTYIYEGAATRNRNRIIALEKQMPGITGVVRDFAYLVPPTAPKQVFTPDTFETTVKDPLVELENRRKANFDTKK